MPVVFASDESYEKSSITYIDLDHCCLFSNSFDSISSLNKLLYAAYATNSLKNNEVFFYTT